VPPYGLSTYDLQPYFLMMDETPPALEIVAEGVGPLGHLLEDLPDHILLGLLPNLPPTDAGYISG
jgi:hypothetical protein